MNFAKLETYVGDLWVGIYFNSDSLNHKILNLVCSILPELGLDKKRRRVVFREAYGDRFFGSTSTPGDRVLLNFGQIMVHPDAEKCLKFTLAHELAHVGQIAKGKLCVSRSATLYIVWCGKEFGMPLPKYDERPWEVEANRFAEQITGLKLVGERGARRFIDSVSAEPT